MQVGRVSQLFSKHSLLIMNVSHTFKIRASLLGESFLPPRNRALKEPNR
jgi:hypothetical protein